MRTDLGPVTAYAAAVAAGYTGTAEDFARQQADYGNSAKQVAEDRTAVENAKESVEQTVGQFDAHAAEVERDAIDAIQAAGDNAKATGVTAVQDAQRDGVTAVETVKESGVKAVQAAQETGMSEVNKAKETGVSAVTAAQKTAQESIETARADAVQAVETAKTEGVAAVNAAVEEGKSNFVTDETLTLSGRAADSKVVGDELAKKADQTDLEYVRKRQNVLVGSETGSRVCVTDAFEAPLEGLVVYGKSTQVTTTGAQLLDLTDLVGKTETRNGATYKINEDQSISVSGTPTEYTSFSLKRISLKAGTYCLSNDVSVGNVFIQLIGGKNTEKNFILEEDSDFVDVYIVFNVMENNTKSFNFTFTPMLNAGDTVLPWEPYTGGKPSPSPEYPQEIVSADRVIMHGKNLIPVDYDDSERLISYDKKNGQWKFDAMPTKVNVRIVNPDKITWSLPIGTYTMTMCDTENVELISINNVTEKKWVVLSNIKYPKKQSTFSISKENLKLGIYLVPSDTTKQGKARLQLEYGIEATDYEPHRTPQTLALTTPASLPGIPVDSGGNYMDETGQRWICDEIDLERGVYVQRVYSVIVDGVDVAFSQAGQYCNMNLKGIPSAKRIDGKNQRITAYSTFTSKSWNFNTDSHFLYITEENYAEILNESCKEHSGEVMYILVTPIETPLSPADIAAYRALNTYGPTTIVETDGAGVKLDYQRDVNIVIKQLTDTIASMTN